MMGKFLTSNRAALAVGTLTFVGAFAAILAAWWVWRNDFEGRADRAIAGYQHRIDSHLLALAGLASFVAEQPTADRRQWQSYLSAIKDWSSLSTAQGVGLAMRYDRATTARVSQRLTQYGVARRPWPTLARDKGFAIVLLEPADRRNRAALGYDMFSERERRRAMTLAMETRRPASTLPVVLKQEIDGPVQPGFLIYVPVLGRSTQSVDHFVYAPYRAGDFFRDILRLSDEQDLHVEVRTPTGELMIEGGAGGTFPTKRNLMIADKSYGVVIRNSGFPLALVVVTILGLALATALTWLAFAQTKRLHLASALAAAKTESEQHAHLVMRELSHRLKNAFARIAAIAHLTGKEKKSSAEFLPLFLTRLDALARSKENLIDPKVESGSFEGLFRRELETTGFGADHGEVDGALNLTEAEFYPMTLCVHELVTNSIKYGALKDGGIISCRVGQHGGNCFVDWREATASSSPPTATGFGTEFITTLLSRLIKATFDRRIDANKLQIRIRWTRQDAIVQA